MHMCGACERVHECAQIQAHAAVEASVEGVGASVLVDIAFVMHTVSDFLRGAVSPCRAFALGR